VAEAPDRFVLLYQDECTFYRQPSAGWLWSWMGRLQPKMPYASKNNTRMRVVGYLNAATGAVHSEEMEAVTAGNLARSVAKLSRWYPAAETIYLVWDNWPNHSSQAVMKALQNQPRVKVLPLPTYSPWLNAIEKVWRWVRQRVTHAHPWCDHFREFRGHVRAELDPLTAGSEAILRYVGLSH
jgi:putative transposase